MLEHSRNAKVDNTKIIMKITFFIGGLSGGGAERVTCNLANFLANRGHEIKVLTMSDDKPSYTIDNKVQRIPLLITSERKNIIYNSVLRLYRIVNHLRKSKVDAYVVMLPVTTILLLRLRFLTKAKVIAAERVDPAQYPVKKQKQLKYLARKADGWVFQIEEERNWYGDATGKAKVSIIPNAINPDFIKPAYGGKRQKVIVTAGRLTEQKNHLLLIKAFAQIYSKFPDHKLIIYGDGPLKEKLLKTTNELSVENDVVLAGYTTSIGEKIKDASLFVLSSDFEGMPNALMEAMVLGLPCVSTDCDGGGAKFLIENEKNGLLVPKGDVDAIVAAMERMLADREFAERCGQEAHKICERLAPERIYEEWELFIEKIANT